MAQITLEQVEESLKATREKVTKHISEIEANAKQLHNQRQFKEGVIAGLISKGTQTNEDINLLAEAFKTEQDAYKSFLFSVTELSNYVTELTAKMDAETTLFDELSKEAVEKSATEDLGNAIMELAQKTKETVTNEDIEKLISARWRACSKLYSFEKNEIETWITYLKNHMF